MGLFDGWRRKQKRTASPKLQKPVRTKPTEGEDSEDPTVPEQSDMNALVAEYAQLTQRKENLQVERDTLTAKLDRGEIESDAFRKELMNMIQEAAMVSEKIQTIGAKLTLLGHRGIR